MDKPRIYALILAKNKQDSIKKRPQTTETSLSPFSKRSKSDHDSKNKLQNARNSPHQKESKTPNDLKSPLPTSLKNSDDKKSTSLKNSDDKNRKSTPEHKSNIQNKNSASQDSNKSTPSLNGLLQDSPFSILPQDSPAEDEDGYLALDWFNIGKSQKSEGDQFKGKDGGKESLKTLMHYSAAVICFFQWIYVILPSNLGIFKPT